ncbi:MAG: DNA internalization-related competence protein ComEC/Rec2 [Granulosicoccaceae bacterium]|jgi:competence protein ComEC
MRTWTIAFLLGVLAVQYLSRLPSIGWSAGLFVAAALLYFFPAYRRVLLPVTAFACGFCWAWLFAQHLLDNRLPADLEGQELRVIGQVKDIPVEFERASRFVFVANTLLHGKRKRPVNWQLRLKWYGKQRPLLRAGQQWSLTVKLKRPHGFANPGGFDYERWLFANGYTATGYVRHPEQAVMLQPEPSFSIDGLRQSIAGSIWQALAGHPRQGIVRALAIGDRAQMNDADWQLLIRTGTNHLVAISGLHIGLVAGFIYWLVLSLVRHVPRLCLLRPAQDYAAVTAILAAIAYAALAGFAIPTQRAVIMISVFMLAVLARRRIASFDTLCLAILLVLVRDPHAVLAPGFWLSFAAVAVIFATLSGQLQPPGLLRQWGRVQWTISIALLPLLVVLFGRISVVAPLANLVAVPWVSFISVPLVFVAMLLSMLGLEQLWSLAAMSLQGLSVMLEGMAAWSFASLTMPAAPAWTVLTAISGIVITLLPRGLPGRWLGLLGILPMLLLRPSGPAPGELLVDVLDVGQGLSIVARTHSRTLVYDTGPVFSARFDAGRAVLLPYLHSLGVERIDSLVISHGDRDHNGGTPAVLDALPVAGMLAGQPAEVSAQAMHCEAGQAWQWDGVRFEVLSPFAGRTAGLSANDLSCVLKISTQKFSLLVPGDIEAGAERSLLLRHRQQLDADILIAPHHGSRSSSTRAFIEAVSPSHVVYSAGYRNRYRLPNAQIVRRYGDIPAYETAHTGKLQFHLSDSGISVQAWRARHRKYWHAD